MIADIHREDIKAAIRKRFGSVAAFEREQALPTKSVNEVLRGRSNRRVSDAINEILQQSGLTEAEPECSGDSSRADLAASLIEGGR